MGAQQTPRGCMRQGRKVWAPHEGGLPDYQDFLPVRGGELPVTRSVQAESAQHNTSWDSVLLASPAGLQAFGAGPSFLYQRMTDAFMVLTSSCEVS